MPSSPDALILCGGAGLRLKSVTGDAPKSMANIGDRPFMELLLRQLGRSGFHRAILAVGYQREAIRTYFGPHAFGLDLAYSLESSPLGTGGAIRNALPLLNSDIALVMNGDSYTDVDLNRFLAEHHQSKAHVSIVVVPIEGRRDCGSVVIDQSSNVTGFEEKASQPASQYANAGVYLISRTVLRDIPVDTAVSIEKELFPRWLTTDYSVKAFCHAGQCIDIGTPERYEQAQRMLAEVEAEISVSQGGLRS